MSTKAKEIYNIETLEVLADKGYFDTEYIEKCEKENIVTYVAKLIYSNGIGDSRYFLDKFKYNEQNDTYTCPNDQVLFCRTKKLMSKLRNMLIKKPAINV